MTATGADQPPTPPIFRLALVPGMVPTSWTRTWAERIRDVRLELVHLPAAEAGEALLTDRADAALLRLPVSTEHLHAIPLFIEDTVLVLPKDHLLTALDQVTRDDLADEVLITPADDVLDWADPPGEPSAVPTPATTADAIELVAAGVGLVVVPLSLARLHHRRDLTYRPLPGAPQSQAALSWSREHVDDPLIEELIGIVRGRTVNSSRGRGSQPAAERTPTTAARTSKSGTGRGTERTGGRRQAGRGTAAKGGKRPGPTRGRGSKRR